ncbi:hypothetical protein ACVWZS_004593, partial [Pseudomonas fragi]
ERICKELEAEDSIASFLASAAGRQAHGYFFGAWKK